MADDLATLGLRIESQQVDTANQRLDQLTQKAGTAKKATEGLAASAAAASSQARQMAEAIAQQEAVLKAQATGAGAATAAVKGNAAAMLALGQQTAAAAAKARDAAQAQANVTNILGAGSKAAKDATAQHKGLAASLGLTAFQMRQIAIQAPDVVQGLASGQRPFQILIQQGGQVAQILGMSEGGIGAALAGLLRFLPGLLGFGAAAAVFGVVTSAVLAGRKEFAALNNELAVTNGYSGVTAASFESMSRRIAEATDTSIGSTKATISALIAQGQLSGQVLTEATSYAEKFAALTGQDATKVVASYASMRDGVTAFAVKHVQQFHDLTQAQVDYIAKLEAEGKWHDAELQYFRDANAAIQKQTVQYGYVEGAVHKVTEAASKMWDALLGLGKPKTLDDQIADLQKVLEKNAFGLRLKAMGMPGVAPGMSGADIANTVDQMARLSFQKDQENVKARGAQTDVGNPLAAQSQGSAQQAAILQAMAARAQAEAGLTADVQKQADLQKQALRYQTAADQARLQQQITDLNLDKSLNDAQRASIAGAMKRAAGINAQANTERARQIDLQTQDALAKQATDIANAQRDRETAILHAQEGLTTDIEARRQIESKLLALADQKAIAEAQAVIASKLATDAEKQIAQAQIDAINGAHGYKQEAIDRQALVDKIHQQAGLAQDALQNQIDILASEEALTDSAAERFRIDKKILDLQQQIATSKALEAVWAAAAAGDQAALAKALADLAAIQKVQANQQKAVWGTAYTNFEDASNAMANVASAISSRDWVRAAHDLMDALRHAAQVLNSTSATLGDKIGAVGGIASGIGGMIGGKAGGVLSGAGQGAVLGAQIGSIIPGIGTAAGAILGGLGGAISGLFGNDHARDDAAKAAEQKAFADQAQRAADALEMLTQQQSDYASALQDFYTASGQGELALKAQRDQELKGLDDATVALKKQTYAWQDYNTALSAANDNVASAQKDLQDAYNAQAQQLQAVRDAAQQASDSLAQFYTNLINGSAATGTRTQQYSSSRSALVALNSRIAGGDQSALGDVQGVVNAFLSASTAAAPDALTQRRDLAFAQQSVLQAKAAADHQASVADQQLTALNAQVAGLMVVNQSVLTVAQAVVNLQGALAARDAAKAAVPATAVPAGGPPGGTYTSTNGDYAAYVQGNADLLASYQSVANDKNWQAAMARLGYGTTIADFGKLHWTEWGSLENRSVRPFARGGTFTNSIVNDPTLFSMGLMGEAGSEAILPLHRGPDGSLGVRAANDNAGWAQVVERLESIEAQLSGFRSEAKQGRDVVKSILDLFRRVTLGGNSVITSAAA